MSTPAEIIGRELRNEAEARLRAFKREREELLKAPARIAELDALIAYLEADADTVRIARRPPPEVPPRAPTDPAPTRVPIRD